MATIFQTPIFQALDANGNPRSGAKLYFYATTTTTPLTIYSDAALGTPQDNPVVADSSGTFAAVYLAVATYKIVLTTSADVTLYTVDPVGNSGAGSFTTLTATGAFTSLGIDDNATVEVLQLTDTIMTIGKSGLSGYSGDNSYLVNHNQNAGVLEFRGGIDTNAARMFLAGSATASVASDYWFETNGVNRYYYDFSALQHQFIGAAYVSTGFRIAQNSTDSPGNGNSTTGAAVTSAGVAYFSSDGSTLNVNRTTDGTNVVFTSGGTAQGSISIAGATVSYNAFFGSHWSQLADGSRQPILRGTIVESIDEMCSWPGEQPEDRLPRFKVSDTPGSTSVYGVFAWWDDDWTETNDAHIGSLGAYLVRMAPGQTFKRGDYVESNGDGCGRVQTDDILRASTVAKITSESVWEVYPDGSFLVPATLHCG